MKKEELNKIMKRIVELEDIIDEKNKEIDFDKINSFKEYEQINFNIAKEEKKELSKLRTLYNLNVEPEFSEIPDYGDKMSLKDFIENCNSGGFINYDGFGQYATNDKITDIIILPSDVKKGTIRKDFDFVVWFNR